MNVSNSFEEIVHSRLHRIANFLLLNASFIGNLGLLKGKMGIAIFFFHYARYTNNKIYEEYAGELIDEIYEEINNSTPVNFENGLPGIGWGIEYLINKEFVEAKSDDVLAELDAMVYKHRLNNNILIDDSSNYFGYGLYHISRLTNVNGDDDELSTLKKKHHLIFLVDECERIFINKRFSDFNITTIRPGFIHSVIWFLLEINKLNLLPAKVRNILNAIIEYYEFIPEKDLTTTDKYVLKFLSECMSNLVSEKVFGSLGHIKLSEMNQMLSSENIKDENVINIHASIICMDLLYRIPESFSQKVNSFENVFKLIDDETEWNKRINDITKDNLSLDGFAGIGFYLLNNIKA